MSDNCLNCGGLIMQPNTTYGYAGKICYCPVNPKYQYQRSASKEPSSELVDVEDKYVQSVIEEVVRQTLIKKVEITSIPEGFACLDGKALIKSFSILQTNIDTLTKQLDEVTKVKERYKRALEFYASTDDKTDSFMRTNDDGITVWMCESDTEIVRDKSGAFLYYGKRAREALNGSGK